MIFRRTLTLVFAFTILAHSVLPLSESRDDHANKKPCNKKKEDENKQEKINKMRQNMLNVFGMKFRPNPKLFGHLIRNTVSAKKYMYNLYKSSVISDCVQMNTNVSSEVMHDADTVVSFVNTNCKFIFLFLFWLENVC